MRTVIIAALFWLVAGSTPANDAVTTTVLMSRDSRLYFPVGEEALVYAHAPFILFAEQDSILSGYIEHAWEGIAISRPLGAAVDSLDPTHLRAVIVPAAVDSQATINIGTDIEQLLLLIENDSLNRVAIIPYKDSREMQEDFFGGLLDGMISFRDLDPKPAEIATTTYPLPYLAALVPNVGRECNYQGQLTTSLYYRFDSSHLAISFDGDQIEMVHRFPLENGSDSTRAGRPYAYSPERGRGLFEAMTNRPDSLSIYPGTPSLDGVAHFFADLIARDRCRVKFASSSARADLRVEFIPVSRSIPSMTVYALYYHLTLDSLPGMLASEQVRRIAAELRYVESPTLPAEYYRRLDIAGRIMTDDLGIFPLFRPTVFLHRHKQLQNVVVTEDSELDFSRAVLVRLPAPPKEGTK
jgi:hypothetical protein